jgi:hypothetical protein
MLSFKKTFIKTAETLSGERIMIACRDHPTFGNDVIYANWPRDANDNHIEIDGMYVDSGHPLALSVSVMYFDIDFRGDIVLWLLDSDGDVYLQSYPNSLVRE